MIPDPSGQLAELIVYITSSRVDLYRHQIPLMSVYSCSNMLYILLPAFHAIGCHVMWPCILNEIFVWTQVVNKLLLLVLSSRNTEQISLLAVINTYDGLDITLHLNLLSWYVHRSKTMEYTTMTMFKVWPKLQRVLFVSGRSHSPSPSLKYKHAAAWLHHGNESLKKLNRLTSLGRSNLSHWD